MRRLKVNAQVTAVTSMIEAFGNILQWSIWIFITKFAGYGTLIQSILLYFVILPYVFLMNTSQNKDRVIEVGWVNVLKNVFGKGEWFSKLRNWCRSRCMTGTAMLSSTSKVSKIKSIHYQKKDGIVRISTIFLNNDQKENEVEKNTETLTINVPMDSGPSSSQFCQKRVILDNRIPSQNADTLALTWISIRHELLNRLLSSISNEKDYIDLTKGFFKFEDSVRIGEGNFHFYLKSLAESNSRGFMKENKKAPYTQDSLANENSETEQRVPINDLKFNGNFKLRMEIRKNHLEKLLRHYKNAEDIYEHYLQIFINMEEDFLLYSMDGKTTKK